jgi:hypothetical protein
MQWTLYDNHAALKVVFFTNEVSKYTENPMPADFWRVSSVQCTFLFFCLLSKEWPV